MSADKMDTYDFVKAVFALFPVDVEFSSSNERIHGSFYRARKKHPRALKRMLFRQQFPFPWSDQVEHCIHTLACCNMFRVLGVACTTFIIPSKLHGRLNESGVSNRIVMEVSKQLQEDLALEKKNA